MGDVKELERPQTCPCDLPAAKAQDIRANRKGRRKRLDSIKGAANAGTAARMVAWVTPESSWHDLRDGRNQGQAAIGHNRKATQRVLSTEEYETLASRYLGSSNSRRRGSAGWRSGTPDQFLTIPVVSPSEKRLVRLADRRRMPPVRKHGKIIRPSSAQAKLQTGAGSMHSSSSILEESSARPQTAAPGLYGATSRGRQSASQQQTTTASWKSHSVDDVPVIEQQVRRLTVGAVDGIAEKQDTFYRGRMVSNAGVQGLKFQFRSRSRANRSTRQIEERINLEHLYSLKQSFEDADEDGSGTLNLEEFKKVLRSSLGLRGKSEDEIVALFMKIDSSSVGQIGWDEFCTYMQLEYEEKEEAYLRQKEVDIHTPANLEHMPHRDSVLRITNMMDGTFAAVSQDGTISFWNGLMELKRTKSVMADQNSNRQKPKWVTDFVVMSQFNKLILGTGDREIQFYELSTLEPYCQVTGLETTPLKLDYCCVGHDECLIMYGDSEGCINIIIINGTGETLRTWKKMPKTDGIASVTLEKVAHSRLTRFIRWTVHGDWVGELRYYEDIRSIISCSNHENSALVIVPTWSFTAEGQPPLNRAKTAFSGTRRRRKPQSKASSRSSSARGRLSRKPRTPGTSSTKSKTSCTVGSTHVESQLKEIKEYAYSPEHADRKHKIAQQNYAQAKRRLDVDQTTFRIHKGVKTFDFSKQCNIIVTGGMDRIVRIWNPYVPSKPTGMLRGHNAPIFGLFIAEDENRVYSLSQDKTIKVWDIKDQVCMSTIRPKTHRIKGDLQACHYNRASKAFAIATDHMALLTHRPGRVQQRGDVVYTHKDPIHCAKYNPSFKHVVTCSDGSVVKLWDFETGNSVFEFSQAHDGNAITTMTFDNTGRRLITGARDGRLKVWNYNNGHCLKKLEREDGYDEVTDVVYIEMNKNRYIISVGWDRHINVYCDAAENIRHVQHPLPMWPEDVKNGHKEDILAIAACPPNMLATSSYDGEVIVWNLVSGHIYCHLRAPAIDDGESGELDGDNSIASLVFLPSRKTNKDTAQLISSGPRGCIHFWNVYNGGSLFARFSCSASKRAAINSMQLTSDDTTLFIGDSLGFVSVWDVDGYCMKSVEDEPPASMACWRAHIEMITSMNLVEDNNVIITSSMDCTVRLWTTEGHYIGTLGQKTPWDIYNPSTFTHPMVPYDVLVDPLSMPIHPVLESQKTAYEIIHQESLEAGKTGREEEDEEVEEEEEEQEGYDENGLQDEKDGRESETPLIMTSYMKSGRQVFQYDDEMIAAELKTKPFKHASGKRLRHEQLKPAVLDKGGPNAYQTLKCFDLDDTPPLTPPSRNRDRNDDPFGLS